MCVGVKDASDKKILVDVLFWAVDNPAPANYLLISGDRDFSNALHQLRMRRYNILLAQPQMASAPLVAAAKSVWLWTSLLAGGPPLSSGESSQLAEVDYSFSKEMLQNSTDKVSSFAGARTLSANNISSANQFTRGNGNGTSDYNTYKGDGKSTVQPPLSRALSLPIITQDIHINTNSDKSEGMQEKQFKKAPHEFFSASELVVTANTGQPSSNPNYSGNIGYTQNCYTHPVMPSSGCLKPPLAPDYSVQPRPANSEYHPFAFDYSVGPTADCEYGSFAPNSHEYHPFYSIPNSANLGYAPSPTTDMPNVGRIDMLEHPLHTQKCLNFQKPNGVQNRSTFVESGNLISYNEPSSGSVSGVQQLQPFNGYPGVPGLSSSSPQAGNTIISNNVTCGSNRNLPSEHEQGLVGVILLALNSLKEEKIIPIESNISDCIRCQYAESKYHNIDVKKALDSAVEQHMVVKQNLGAIALYVGHNEKLWKCVNPIGGKPNMFPQSTWDQIENFLSSSAGKSAVYASKCRLL